MSKLSMFASGFCACACFIKVMEDSMIIGIGLGLLALANFIIGKSA